MSALDTIASGWIRDLLASGEPLRMGQAVAPRKHGCILSVYYVRDAFVIFRGDGSHAATVATWASFNREAARLLGLPDPFLHPG